MIDWYMRMLEPLANRASHHIEEAAHGPVWLRPFHAVCAFFVGWLTLILGASPLLIPLTLVLGALKYD